MTEIPENELRRAYRDPGATSELPTEELRRRLEHLRGLFSGDPPPAEGVHLALVKDTEREYLPLRGPTVVGSGADAHVTLVCQYVSRRHCRFEEIDGDWQVRDLGSKNGTFVNGERVEETQLLRDGDIMQIGSVTIVFLAYAPKLEVDGG